MSFKKKITYASNNYDMHKLLLSNYFSAFLFTSILATGCARATNPTTSSTTQSQSLSQGDLKTYVIKESQPGGKLDFFTPIKGHEYDGRQIKPGIYATGLEFALYNWGRSVKDLGVKTIEEAYDIYSTFKGQPANQRDKDTIKLGFNKELDK